VGHILALAGRNYFALNKAWLLEMRLIDGLWLGRRQIPEISARFSNKDKAEAVLRMPMDA
jgi:hypothetical protein